MILRKLINHRLITIFRTWTHCLAHCTTNIETCKRKWTKHLKIRSNNVNFARLPQLDYKLYLIFIMQMTHCQQSVSSSIKLTKNTACWPSTFQRYLILLTEKNSQIVIDLIVHGVGHRLNRINENLFFQFRSKVRFPFLLNFYWKSAKIWFCFR